MRSRICAPAASRERLELVELRLDRVARDARVSTATTIARCLMASRCERSECVR